MFLSGVRHGIGDSPPQGVPPPHPQRVLTMSNTVTSRSEIPSARFYVLANDSFMSGWGQAEGKTNTVILPCTDWEEAKTVEANARARSEMRRVRITGAKPTLRPHVLYSLLNREHAERWYTPGGFAPEPQSR